MHHLRGGKTRDPLEKSKTQCIKATRGWFKSGMRNNKCKFWFQMYRNSQFQMMKIHPMETELAHDNR
jgi:hypothetical protein